jgi:glucokinase
MMARRTLAIDIGGTKFSMAVFESERLAQRESRATLREGGREWMLGQIREIAAGWMSQAPLDSCGVGFGGPVDFAARRVVQSTHVQGWRDFALADWIESQLGLAAPQAASGRSAHRRLSESASLGTVSAGKVRPSG